MSEQREALSQLLGAYFHQDWDLDGGRVSDTVTAFLREPRDTVIAAADQIGELIAMDLGEGALEARLGEMGCQYDAGETDDDYRRWLREVLQQLRGFLTASAVS